MDVETFFSLKHFAHRELWKKGAALWSPLGLLEAYLRSQKLGAIEIEVPPHVFLVNPETISIGKGTVIEPGVMIQGPCIIGEGCIIRHGALLRDGVICAQHCVIGHSAEIKHSILLDAAAVTHFVYVGDSIIGSRANLGAGVKCANLRLNRREVMISWEGKRIGTGLKKMGAIVGDGAQIGCNCVLNPGTLLGRECVCYPLLNVSGFVPPRSQIKSSPDWKILPADAKSLLEQIGK